MNDKISSYRLGGWLVVAMSGPFVYLAGRQSWASILTVAAVCLPCMLLVYTRPTYKLLSGSFYRLLEYGFLVAAGIAVSQWSAAVWPSGKSWPSVPLTLLALATASAWSGANRASKGIGTLFWLVTIIYSVLLTFGLRNVQASYLLPKWENPGWISWFVFLLPCAAQFLPRQKGRLLSYFPVLMAMGILVTLWAEGNLSLGAAKQVSWPFYEAGESISLFGVANRLEPFISVGATVGFYGLYSLLFSGAGHLVEQIKKGWGRCGVLLGGILSAVGVLFRWQIPYFVLVVGAFVLWVALPVLGSIFPQKNCEKEQNNA